MPRRSNTVPIFAVGNAATKQAAQRADGQWFYRVRKTYTRKFIPGVLVSRAWGRWLECSGRPDGAWYDPRLGGARLPDSGKLSTAAAT